MNFDNNPNIKDQNFETWFRNHYLYLILGILFIFISLPVVAPILMKVGINLPAKVIYWIYGFFCHQLPFRSWFLFGTQPFYPLASAGLNNIHSFESVFHQTTIDFGSVRIIVGNSDTGFKIAICQRDIAMYSSLLAFGILFASRNRNIDRIPFWIWILIGVIPIGLDGITQYLGNLPLPFFGAMMRESTPALRTITGCLFGLFSGWYIFPTLESTINKNSISKPEL